MLIAFASGRDGDGEIYVMHPDGSDQTRLTDDGTSAGFPAWSPDGTRIAFTSNLSGDLDIYVIDADGTDLFRVTDHFAGDKRPMWTPVQ